MLKKIIHFIKYNNLTVFGILAVFLLTTGVFAQTEAGQEAIGQKQTRVEGFDNTLLLEADLENFDMDFKIEKIEEDEIYYYVTYTYLDLAKENRAWQYQMQENIRRAPLKLKKDLGKYLAEELKEEYDARLKDLKKAQTKAMENGEEKRMEVVEYSGLIGKTLDLAGKAFSNYEPIKIREIPSPSLSLTILAKANKDGVEEISLADDLTEIYNDYIEEKDPDSDDVFGVWDNCPNDYNPRQLDADDDGVGDACDSDEEEIIVKENKEATSTADQTLTEDGATTTSQDVVDNQEEADVFAEPEPEEVEIIELPTGEEENGTSTS